MSTSFDYEKHLAKLRNHPRPAEKKRSLIEALRRLFEEVMDEREAAWKRRLSRGYPAQETGAGRANAVYCNNMILSDFREAGAATKTTPDKNE